MLQTQVCVWCLLTIDLKRSPAAYYIYSGKRGYEHIFGATRGVVTGAADDAHRQPVETEVTGGDVQCALVHCGAVVSVGSTEIVSAFTRTGMTAPVFRSKGR